MPCNRCQPVTETHIKRNANSASKPCSRGTNRSRNWRCCRREADPTGLSHLDAGHSRRNHTKEPPAAWRTVSECVDRRKLIRCVGAHDPLPDVPTELHERTRVLSALPPPAARRSTPEAQQTAGRASRHRGPGCPRIDADAGQRCSASVPCVRARHFSQRRVVQVVSLARQSPQLKIDQGRGFRNGSASGPSSANPPRTNPPHAMMTHMVAGSGPRFAAYARSAARAPIRRPDRP